VTPKRLLALFALLPAFAWAADAPAPAAKPVRLSTDAPEYPANARRFNVSGTVLAKLRIEADGRVSKVEIVKSDADILSKAVVQAASNWRYKPMAEPTEGLVQIPFKLSGADEDDYAFSTDIRSMSAPAPASASDLGIAFTEGWSQVRLLIDAAGMVEGTLVLKSSADQFRATCEAILSRLRFAPAEAERKGYKSTTVNEFFIGVRQGGEIKVEQFDGA
jgi:TonB family protein